jgi:hypothetical protein
VSLLFDPLPAQSCASLERNNSNELLVAPRMNQDRKRAERPDNDRHVLRSWNEWEFDGRDRRIILCVETVLELRPGYEGFDPAQLDDLVAEATDLMRASASPIDSIRIVPER